MTHSRRVAGIAVGLVATVAIVAGSHVDLDAFADPAPMVRLSWSARPERIERCVRTRADELAKLPVHMRREVVCEGATARYRLEVTLGDSLADAITVRGGGLRGDREVYVLREVRLAAAPTRISVRFVRLDSSTVPATADSSARPADVAAPPDDRPGAPAGAGELAGRGVREAEERERRRAEAIPPVLSLDTVVALTSRSVLLITYDPMLRRLVTRSGAP